MEFSLMAIKLTAEGQALRLGLCLGMALSVVAWLILHALGIV